MAGVATSRVSIPPGLHLMWTHIILWYFFQILPHYSFYVSSIVNSFCSFKQYLVYTVHLSGRWHCIHSLNRPPLVGKKGAIEAQERGS